MTEQSTDSVLRNAVLNYISTVKQSHVEKYLYVNLMSHFENVADYEELQTFIKDYTPEPIKYQDLTWEVSAEDKPNAGGAA